MRFADETEFSYRTVTIALVSEYHLQDAGGAPRRYDRTVRTIFRRACPDSLNACAARHRPSGAAARSRRAPRGTPEPKRAFLGLLGWNSYGTEGAQRVAKVRRREGSRTGCTSAKPLPPAATGCRLDRMVRRGSPVRVRKRASLEQRDCAAVCLSVAQSQRPPGVHPARHQTLLGARSPQRLGSSGAGFEPATSGL